MNRDIIVSGGTRGDRAQLLRACEEEPPDAVVILAERELGLQLQRSLGTVVPADTGVKRAAGDRDADLETFFRFLSGASGKPRMRGGQAVLGAMVILGIIGVVTRRAWYPRLGPSVQLQGMWWRTMQGRSPPDDVPHDRPQGAWNSGVLPEDIEALDLLLAGIAAKRGVRPHPHGPFGPGEAARLGPGGLVVHARGDGSYEAVSPGGVRVRGVGMGEVFRIRPGDLP